MKKTSVRKALKKNASRYKTAWDLSLFYAGPDDPAIEKDAKAIERAYAAFEKKYRGAKEYLKGGAALAKALRDYEKLYTTLQDGKPAIYFAYRKELDGADSEAEARLRKLDDRFTKAGNRVQFFELSLGKLPASRQKAVLADARLARYRRQLAHLFETAKHDLTESEEKIMALKASVARGMWVSGVDTAVNKQMVKRGKTEIPVNEAINLISSLPNQKERHALWDSTMDALDRVSDFAESELNAVITDKRINDELRGFPEPYAATVLAYENDPAVVRALVETVTDAFTISQRFYTLKKKLAGLTEMRYADRSIAIGKVAKRFSFDESVAIVRDAYAGMNPAYAAILDSFLENGQIDVYPKQGKGGGAFCSSSYGNPTLVLLNHVDEPRSLMTIAHEMGHAIHAERAKSQPPLYQGHSTSVAETASTFFEGVVFEKLLEGLSQRERMIMLHDRLQDEIATIQRQIAFFNFELALHTRVRKEGWVPKAEIMRMLNDECARYLGKAVRMQEKDGLFFVAVGHFRNPFYVYSYAYGQLISKALLARVKEDRSYIAKVDEFLAAGDSKKPEQIFKDIGIDVGPALFALGLAAMARDIDELESLAKSVKK